MNLTEKINLILGEELRQYEANAILGRQSPQLGSLNIGLNVPPGLLAQDSEAGFVSSQNVDRLLKLHAMLDEADRKKFISALLTHVRIGVPASKIAYISFLTLHRLGRTKEAIEIAGVRHEESTKPGRSGRDFIPFSNIVTVLSGVVATEYGQLSRQWCEEVRAALGTHFQFSTTLRDRINQVLLHALDAELGDANPEIYSDRDKVISIWEARFGDPTIPLVIAEIDQAFRDGITSDLRLATCVSRIRTLLVHVCRAVANKLVSQGGPDLSAIADEHVLFQYLRANKIVDDPEWNVLRSLYNKASAEGSHSLTAKAEEARLVKNMTYEFLLLLLGRAN